MKTYKLVYAVGERIPIPIPAVESVGTVIEISISQKEISYHVAYWLEGKRETTWITEAELC